ncbi:MAG: hypothetical protein LBV16_04525, partial [Elusimicrobiota bacterium]|nr:hypothetical protein [Elusimicrobiota bacterium]
MINNQNQISFVGADPSVCPSQINLPLNRKFVVTGFGFAIACVSHVYVVIAGKTRNLRRFLFSSFPNVSPTPSLPSVPIGNLLRLVCALRRRIHFMSFFKTLLLVTKSSLPSVPIGNPFSSQSASLIFDLQFFNRLCRLFSLPLFSPLNPKLSFKFLLTAFIVVFLSLSAFAARWKDYSSGGPYTETPAANAVITGYGGANGGAIYLSGSVTLNINGAGNLTFQNNGGTGTTGGGVAYLSGATLNITRTGTSSQLIFQDNIATGGAGKGAGAIYSEGTSNVTLNAATIIMRRNQGSTDGGVVAYNGGVGTFNVPTSVVSFQITNNTAQFGGAFYSNGGTHQWYFRAKTTTFADNAVFYGIAREAAGGVVQINGGQGNIYFDGGSAGSYANVEYLRNSANDSQGSGGLGGVLALYSKMDLHYNYVNLNFDSNYAYMRGGVIWAQSNVLVEFNNFTFKANNNKARYGGIIALQGDARVTFNNGSIEFTNNTSFAPDSMGNISLGASNVMSLSNISSLIGRNNRASQAGLLYLPNVTFNFTGMTMELTGNTAFSGSGGGFYFTRSTTVFGGQNMTFLTNTAWMASGNGGAIYIEYSSSTFGAPQSMRFEGNSAGGSGGGMYFQNSRAYFTQSNSMQFLSNRAATNGGAMYFSNSYASFAPTSMTFNGNSAAAGGGMYFMQSTAAFGGAAASSMAFTNNSATAGSGGVMYFENSTATFSANWIMNFQSNIASLSGGGMYFTNVAAAYFRTARMMRFSLNSASNGSGGAMYFNNVPIVQFTPTTMVFESNRAIGTGLGGGMYFSGVRVAQFLPTSMTFQGNIAAVSGGGMYFVNSTVTFG